MDIPVDLNCKHMQTEASNPVAKTNISAVLYNCTDMVIIQRRGQNFIHGWGRNTMIPCLGGHNST